MELPKTIRVSYLKSPGFKTVHADGATGGATPDLNVFLAFWSQRGAIPDATIHEISADGQFEDTPKRVIAKSAGIVREVDCGVMMSLDAAKVFHAWLGQRLSEVEALKNQAKTNTGAPK